MSLSSKRAAPSRDKIPPTNRNGVTITATFNSPNRLPSGLGRIPPALSHVTLRTEILAKWVGLVSKRERFNNLEDAMLQRKQRPEDKTKSPSANSFDGTTISGTTKYLNSSLLAESVYKLTTFAVLQWRPSCRLFTKFYEIIRKHSESRRSFLVKNDRAPDWARSPRGPGTVTSQGRHVAASNCKKLWKGKTHGKTAWTRVALLYSFALLNLCTFFLSNHFVGIGGFLFSSFGFIFFSVSQFFWGWGKKSRRRHVTGSDIRDTSLHEQRSGFIRFHISRTRGKAGWTPETKEIRPRTSRVGVFCCLNEQFGLRR